MTTTRAARLARVRGAVDREHGEPIRVLPKIVGDFGRTDDPDRAAFDAVGVPIVAAASERNLSGGRALGWTAQVAVQPVALAVDPVAWPAAPTVVVGDAVELVARSVTFEVARVDRDGRSRLVWSLART